MLTPGWARRWRLVSALMAGMALGAAPWAAFGAHEGGGSVHAEGGFGGGLHQGGVAHYGARGGYGRGYGARGGYYGRGYYAGYGWGWGGWGWGGWWWGPGWWGLGLFLPIIPWYYATVWWDGVPYYYGDDAYYVWNGDAGQYEQVTPPADFSPSGPPPGAAGANGAPAAPPTDSELFAYPKAGQSVEQQARDRAECRKWASDQTASGAAAGGGGPPPAAGAAPSAPGGGNSAASDAMARHQAYLRAEAVCLEGRNYSVG